VNARGARVTQSPCCGARLFASLGDGVLIGTCAACGVAAVRMNPKTGVDEWLDSKSPWTDEPLRPVVADAPEAT
jgi:hypothetical protein